MPDRTLQQAGTDPEQRRRARFQAELHAFIESKRDGQNRDHGVAQVGEILCVGKSTVYTWLGVKVKANGEPNGTKKPAFPDADVLAQFCEAVGISADWLLCGTGHKRFSDRREGATPEDVAAYVAERVAGVIRWPEGSFYAVDGAAVLRCAVRLAARELARARDHHRSLLEYDVLTQTLGKLPDTDSEHLKTRQFLRDVKVSDFIAASAETETATAISHNPDGAMLHSLPLGVVRVKPRTPVIARRPGPDYPPGAEIDFRTGRIIRIVSPSTPPAPATPAAQQPGRSGRPPRGGTRPR